MDGKETVLRVMCYWGVNTSVLISKDTYFVSQDVSPCFYSVK